MKATKTLTNKVNDLRYLKMQRDELDAQIKAIEDYLKEHMEKHKDYEIVGDDFKITWNMVVSNRFSQSDFKKACPDLYEKFTALSESRRFLLS